MPNFSYVQNLSYAKLIILVKKRGCPKTKGVRKHGVIMLLNNQSETLLQNIKTFTLKVSVATIFTQGVFRCFPFLERKERNPVLDWTLVWFVAASPVKIYTWSCLTPTAICCKMCGDIIRNVRWISFITDL